MRIVPQRKRSRTVADESDEGTSGSKRPKLGIVPFLNRIGMPMHSPLEARSFLCRAWSKEIVLILIRLGWSFHSPDHHCDNEADAIGPCTSSPRHYESRVAQN